MSVAAEPWIVLIGGLSRARAEDLYTPALDWRGSGRRLHGGGRDPHPQARRVLGGAACYVVPGCHALEAPWSGDRVLRIFVDTPLSLVAARCEGRKVGLDELRSTLVRHLTPAFEAILAYRDRADRVLDGALLEGDGLPIAADALRVALGLPGTDLS
jgi:hypothetical protein